jgi:hypothetical protein
MSFRDEFDDARRDLVVVRKIERTARRLDAAGQERLLEHARRLAAETARNEAAS